MKKLILFLSITLLFSLDFELPTDLITLPTHKIKQYEINESNDTKIVVKEENFQDNFISSTPTLNICVLINKKKFFKYIPSIINSLNAYLIYKNINYFLEIKDINETTNNCKYVLVYSLDKKFITQLSENNNTNYYIPVFNKNEFNLSENNLFFGGIDFKSQVNTLSQFIDDNKSITINEATHISKKLFEYEKNLNLNIIPYFFPSINYKDLNNSFIFFNTSAGKTAQVLSNITSKEIETKLQLSTQINYDPLLISITQIEDTQKLLIANSLINIPDRIESNNLILNSDIKYNWLNYASLILLNKIYNTKTQDDEFYMNDFNIYIFENQIEYKTKLYQIINGGFNLIDN